MTNDKRHTFDWHAEEKGHNGTFLGWAVLSMMPGHKQEDKPFFDELSTATKGFTECELGITLNGIEIDAKKFMERLDRAMDHAVDREAAKLIENLPRLVEIQDLMATLETKLKEQLIQAADEAGIELSEERW